MAHSDLPVAHLADAVADIELTYPPKSDIQIHLATA